MNRYRVIFSVFVSLFVMVATSNLAFAQVTCIENYLSDRLPVSSGFAPSDVETLISQMASGFGLSSEGITAIPCDGIGKVVSSYFDIPGYPKGEYISYDPIWVREVIGNNLDGKTSSKAHAEAVVLFGHELGHVLLRHFTSSASLPSIDKETAADHFAGCAAATMNVKWQDVSDFLGRIRGENDTTYPSRAHSVAQAKLGYDKCARTRPPKPSMAEDVKVNPPPAAKAALPSAIKPTSIVKPESFHSLHPGLCEDTLTYVYNNGKWDHIYFKHEVAKLDGQITVFIASQLPIKVSQVALVGSDDGKSVIDTNKISGSKFRYGNTVSWTDNTLPDGLIYDCKIMRDYQTVTPKYGYSINIKNSDLRNVPSGNYEVFIYTLEGDRSGWSQSTSDSIKIN